MVGGRTGREPHTKALAYFSLGDRAEEEVHAYLTSSGDPDQVDLLADAVGL